ncbi:calcium-binding protein, partial [Paraburkholderia sediminicola]|uniref:calcium-binding protein n=1 Tax=Paraburkholderia sediminicola TaxID=458836 RepID=UPI0038BBAACE
TGADSLYGTSGANLFDGKGGGDYEYGDGGNDTFVFNAGYGHLEINESYSGSAQPVLQFGTGITAASVTVKATSSGNSLVLTDGVSGDQIQLDYALSSSTSAGVQTVQFADGTTWTQQQLIQMETTGTTGADSLYGTSGANLFDGKGGNDLEVGDGGNDTFVFNAGYGHLEINDSYSGSAQPVLQFGTGITAASVTAKATSNGTGLVLTDSVAGDQITLDNMLGYSGYGVQSVQFTDGTALTAAQLVQMETTGTTGADSIYGTSG